MLRMITCAPQFICVARYGPLFNSQGFFSPCEYASPAPSKEWCCRMGRPIPVKNVVVNSCGFIFLRSIVSTNWPHVYSDQVHDAHSCNTKTCPLLCELCNRRCDRPHLHGLTPGPGMHHLCGLVRSLAQKVILIKHRNE